MYDVVSEYNKRQKELTKFVYANIISFLYENVWVLDNIFV